MILVLDVGNTNLKCGIWQDGTLAHSWRMHTNTVQTSDELGVTLGSFFYYLGLKPSDIEGIAISSVIPSFNFTVLHMCKIYFGLTPIFVGPGIKTGMKISYDNPKELGADRIANAIAAYELYGGPVITIDFGTATSYGVVSQSGDFLGGVICPGIRISAEALTMSAAKLPKIELNVPDFVIGKNTVACMQSGIIFGYVGQVEYIVSRIKSELGSEATVVITGGFADVIAGQTTKIDVINPLLTLQGLHIIYQRNR